MTTPPVVPLANPRLARVRVALVICVASLAALVAAIAYLVSFEAISAYVFTIGAMPHWLRWCGPLLIDTFITIATAFLLWLALSGAHLASEHDAWFAWLLIATAPAAASAPDQRGNATTARAISPRQSRRAIGANRPVFERLAAAGQPVSWRQFAAAFDPPMPRRTAQRHLAHHQAAAPSANGQQPIADPEEVTR